jgi:hypothetical protein
MKDRPPTFRGKFTSRTARLILAAVMLGDVTFSATPPVWAQSSATDANAKRDTEEKDDCVRNLKLIYAAIQAYKFEHKDVPNWLSDLVPQYLADTSVLICPVCKRTGETETSPLADPRVPSSYVYQFSPVPLEKNYANWTWRDWKRRQMGLVGSSVPLVCCRHHGVVLNLAFDGRVYESSGPWESLLTNQINIADLTAAAIFSADPTHLAQHLATNTDSVAPPFPPRDLQAAPGLIDLAPYYNVHLTDSWLSGTNNNLAALTPGIQILAGVMFDARGLIQLAGKKESSKHFPAIVPGIKVQQKCQRLHFLHACAFGNSDDNEGHEIGYYVVHFADKKDANIPIIFSRDVRDWWHSRPSESAGEEGLTVAWTGTNPASAGKSIRLFTTAWVNPSPDVQIDSIDFVSHMDGPAPFVVAITAD